MCFFPPSWVTEGDHGTSISIMLHKLFAIALLLTSDTLVWFSPSLTLNFRETQVKHCNSKVSVDRWMDPGPRQLRSNTEWQRFWYPGETQDQQRRDPQQGIQIQDNMVDDNNAQNNNVVPARVQPTNNAPAQQWVTNPMVGHYYPETRQSQATFHRKTRRLLTTMVQ